MVVCDKINSDAVVTYAVLVQRVEHLNVILKYNKNDEVQYVPVYITFNLKCKLKRRSKCILKQTSLFFFSCMSRKVRVPETCSRSGVCMKSHEKYSSQRGHACLV